MRKIYRIGILSVALILAMVIFFSIIWAIVFTSDFSRSMGGGEGYKFHCSLVDMKNCLEKIKKENDLNIPAKWRKFDDWDQTGYDFLNGKVFYFHKDNIGREEMYYVSCVIEDDLSDVDKDKIFPSDTLKIADKDPTVSLRAVFEIENEKTGWKSISDLDKKEVTRVEERFKKEIVNKISITCNCK